MFCYIVLLWQKITHSLSPPPKNANLEKLGNYDCSNLECMLTTQPEILSPVLMVCGCVCLKCMCHEVKSLEGRVRGNVERIKASLLCSRYAVLKYFFSLHVHTWWCDETSTHSSIATVGGVWQRHSYILPFRLHPCD